MIDGAKDNPEIAPRFLEIIDKQSSRLTLLIDDLLLLARLDSDRVELRLETLELKRAAQEAIDDAAQGEGIADLDTESQFPRVGLQTLRILHPEVLLQIRLDGNGARGIDRDRGRVGLCGLKFREGSRGQVGGGRQGALGRRGVEEQFEDQIGRAHV